MQDKQKLDIEKSVLTYITNNVDLPERISLGEALDAGNTVSYIMANGSPGERYYDLQRKKHYLFTISVKDNDSMEAINILNDIMELMEIKGPNKFKSLQGSFKFVSSTMRNNTSFAGTVDDNGTKRAVYTGSFEITIII